MPNSLVVVLDSGTHILAANDPRYGQILKTEINEEAIKKILAYKELVESREDHRIEVKPEENKILIDKQEMPDVLKKKFLELKRKHKPRSYLLKFWDKLQKNPNPNSIKMLYQFLEHNGHPIMADGNFVAYKAVGLDLKDHHSGTNIHKCGKIIQMDRAEVNPDPNQTCSTGLHVCSWDYTQHFHTHTSKWFEVLVDPCDVVAVPVDYHGTKMRVCRYKVYREVKQGRK